MSNSIIKKCPFCGGEGVIQKINTGLHGGKWTDSLRVVCKDCGASRRDYYESVITRDAYGEIIIEKDGRVAAIENWNERVSEDKPGIYYLCDKKECSNCTYPTCRHTSDITHAKNFTKFDKDGFNGCDSYWEYEVSDGN